MTAVAISTLTLCLMMASASVARTYTTVHPLVYEDAWDLWPYVYLNGAGEPEGYNIDLLKILFDELDIPFIIKLKPTKEALEDLRAGRSDLMLGMVAAFHDEYASYGREVVGLFTHCVVTPKSQPVVIHGVDDLSRHKVIVHQGSFSHHLMIDSGWQAQCVPYDDMKEAIQKLTPIDTPHGEYRFMSNDSVLLHRLDSVYAYICSTERLVPIQNKWFYPERTVTGAPKWIWYVAAVVAVLLLLLLYTQAMLRIRERRMTKLVAQHNRRLALILRTTKVRVFLYDLKNGALSWMNSDGKMDQRQHVIDEYRHLYKADSFAEFRDVLEEIAKGRQESCVVELVSDSNKEKRDDVIKLSVFRRNKKGEPTVIAGIIDDQTERRQASRKAKDNMLRYQSIFSTSMVDMTYYDTEGILTDINQKACGTFRCNREQLLAERVPFNYAMEDPSLKLEHFEGCYSTHIIKSVDNPNLADSVRFSSDMYYEQQLLPVYDASNRFLGIFGSGRDVTEFVNSFHQLKRSISQMMRAAQDVTDYINNINYAMHVGGVRLVNYSAKTHILTIYREMNVVQLTLTQSRCLSLLLSLQFHMAPVYDENGDVDSYFGMCRDVSAEMATAEELEREKAKAKEVEGVKNAFLRNMSYEIRTPITTVVGFAELFVEEHDPADEDQFIHEIKTNATYLLKLVNEILFLSRLDARMIEFKRQPTDFAMTFEGHCQMGWVKEQKTGVAYEVVSPYEHLVVALDDANVGQVVEKVVENAARYTESGFVRARYDYIGDRLLITIDDSGRGIAPEDQQTMFERFRLPTDGGGTSLGMAICKELVMQMDGAININSAPGKGTTVWIEIPCKATTIEKRKTVNWK